MTRMLSLLTLVVSPVAASAGTLRTQVSLNGEWQTAEATRIDALPGQVRWSATQVPGVHRSFTGKKRWFRRKIDVPADWQGRRVRLRYDGVRWNSHHFVNGQPVGQYFEGFSPFELDVTKVIRFGQSNELLVGACDWQGVFAKPMAIDTKLGWHRIRHAPKDLVLSPIGGRYGEYGIWADVAMLVRDPVHVRDATIRTSVRRQELTVIIELANDGSNDAAVTLAGRVVETGGVRLPDKSVTIKPGKRTTVTSTIPWPSPKLWTYETPHLYHLQLELTSKGRVVDRLTQRFGFREFWCDGPWFYLNGVRLICRASSMWPLGANTVAEAADRLRRLKAVNVMCFRTHTQPWRQLWYEAADEVGILMIPEGPVWNDDGVYRVNDDRFWDHYAAELTGMVRRMKNNPSVVAWSLENEMYGSRMRDETPRAKARLVELGRRMRQWDPTRPCTYESDGDPGGVADIIGIHYPHEMPRAYLYPNTCYWMDRPIKPTHWFTEGQPTWQWDRTKPLYLGEYLWCPSPTPAAYSVMYGDRAYDDYAYYKPRAIGRAWQMQTRAYRVYRVSGLCPWTCAGGSLDVGKDPMAAAQAESMRPLAAFVKEYNTRFYGDQTIRRTLQIMNDTLHSGSVKVTWQFAVGGKTCGRGQLALEMKPADLAVRTIELKTPKVSARSDARLTVRARMARAPDFQESIACSVFPPISLNTMKTQKVGLLAAGRKLRERLVQSGLEVQRVATAGEIPDEVGILIAAPNTLAEADCSAAEPVLRIGEPPAAERGIHGFLARGGRILMLAQRSPHVRVGSIQFAPRQSTMTFPLSPSHALLRDVRPDDLQFWGPDHVVADAHVDRTACGGQPIVVSGSSKGIGLVALAECQVDRGLVIASGLRLLDAMDAEPAASLILRNALQYMDCWQPAPEPVLICGPDGDDALPSLVDRLGFRIARAHGPRPDLPTDARAFLLAPNCSAETVMDLVARLNKTDGLTWWHRPRPETFAAVMERLNLPYRLSPATGPIRLRRDSPFVGGLAQADLYWLTEHPKTSVGWAMTPMDASIIDHEVVVAGRLQLDRARTLRADAFKAIGSRHNQPRDRGILLCTHGSMVGDVDFGAGGSTIVGIQARGWPAAGVWPRLDIRVAGRSIGQVTVNSREPMTYSRVGTIPAGQHRLAITFLNDMQTPEEDRNVWIGAAYVQPAAPDPRGFGVHTTPAALVSLPIGAGRLVVDTIRWDQADPRNRERGKRFAQSILTKLGAQAGEAPIASVEAERIAYQETAHNRPQGEVLVLATNGWARVPLVCDRPGRYVLRIHASGTKARDEWPLLVVRLGTAEVARVRIGSAERSAYDVPMTLDGQRTVLELAFVNDVCRPPEDRNVHLDRVEVWAHASRK